MRILQRLALKVYLSLAGLYCTALVSAVKFNCGAVNNKC